MSYENLISSWLVLAIYCCKIRADTVNLQETLRCTTTDLNSVPSLAITSPLTVHISSIFDFLVGYKTVSRIMCAFICSNFEQNDCHAITYDETDQSCELYSWDLQTVVNQTLADQNNKYCWKTKVFEISSSLNSSHTTNTTTLINSLIAIPAGLAGCLGASSLTTYTKPGTSCPAMSSCVCDKSLNVQYLPGFNNANDCFTRCSINPNCLAFAFFSGFCYIANTTSPLMLIDSLSSFTCFCNKSATAAVTSTTASTSTVTVTINGVGYSGLSCYPRKLFSGTSYIPKIPIAGGKQADCKCQGGLSLQSGTFVHPTASTFAACFSACEQVASPPCKAFAFMEANNTCVIGPTSSNGDSNDRGVLQCYT